MRRTFLSLSALLLALVLSVSPVLSDPASAVDVKSLKVGDTLTFGTYEQDNNSSNGKEPIEWIVLDRKGNEVLLISLLCLETRIYEPLPFLGIFFKSVTWESCELRKWLNSTFLNAAFDSKQREKISRKRIKNLDNTKYNTKGGNDTDDRVFVLSINEAVRYFPSNEARRAMPTVYAYYQGAQLDDEYYCNWWLRSPGYFQYGVATVDDDGEMSYAGAEPNVGFIAVRPALWLDVSK